MRIEIDNREQRPLIFDNKSIKSVVNTTLNIGDYRCVLSDGHVIPIVFERKSMPDLYGSLSSGYERFKKEIDRSIESKIKLTIIVESSLTRINQGFSFSKRTPDSLIQQIFTINMKYNVNTIFCNSREESAQYIINTFLAYYKQYNNKET